MKHLFLLLLGFIAMVAALAGCASAGRVPERVAVEVPVPCIPAQDVPQRPQLRAEADLMAMDRYRRTLAVWSNWLKLEIYAAELEALVAGCSRLPP